jgi:hypothetical protein
LVRLAQANCLAFTVLGHELDAAVPVRLSRNASQDCTSFIQVTGWAPGRTSAAEVAL